MLHNKEDDATNKEDQDRQMKDPSHFSDALGLLIAASIVIL
jgi:hypothetical protein